MEENRDVGKILLRLNNRCYEKGMKNVSFPLRGVRNAKIADIDRKVVIPQIIRSKEYTKFIKQFLKNIGDEIQVISEQENIKKIVENPESNTYTYENCDIELLYLYLVSLNEKKYDKVLKEIIDKVCCDEDNKVVIEKNQNKEFEELKKLCQTYEKELEQLKEISRQRKVKIKEYEMKCNILIEENVKLKAANEEIKKLLEKKEQELEHSKISNSSFGQKEVETELNNKKSKIAIVGKKLIIDTLNTEQIEKISLDNFEKIEEMQLNNYSKILVQKKDIPIAKLRRIKKVLGIKGIFLKDSEEINNYISMMEEENENRSN